MLKAIAGWFKCNPNKAMSLVWPIYIWGKAVAHTRFHFDFLPETDNLVTTLLTVLGVSVAAGTSRAKAP